MHIPKQSIPVQRNLNSVSVSASRGVNASTLVETLLRPFNRRSKGTCECTKLPGKDRHSDGLWYRNISPLSDDNKCTRGFSPQCDQNEGCACVADHKVKNGGHFYIPTNPPKYMQMF